MNDPPDQTAEFSAENLLSAAGITVPKYSFTRSGYSRSPESISRKITPCFSRSSLMEWYTTSDSYWADTPARNFRSASGIPSLSKVSFGTVIPAADNKFSALNSAVWSGGSFIYVPRNTHVELPLQAYFRINAENMGQFERTLIIADEGSRVHYRSEEHT